MEISFDRARVQLDVVHSFLVTTYWCPDLRRDVFDRAVASSLCVGAYEGGRQLGFARVVTDFATFAWICDVFVDENARGAGVGKAMMRAIVEHPELQTLRRFCLATADAHGLYEQFGFQPVPAERWMERLSPPSTWQSRSGAT